MGDQPACFSPGAPRDETAAPRGAGCAADLRTNRIMDFRGLDSSIILILRGGILMSVGDFLESLSQAILVGIILVGRLGVRRKARKIRLRWSCCGPPQRGRLYHIMLHHIML